MEPKNPRSQLPSREKILLGASSLFYRGGYQSTSVDDILAVSGVAKSNFYYHFKSKEDLACAVLDRRFEEYEYLMRCSLSDRTLSPKQRIQKFYNNLYDAQAELDMVAGCLFGNFAAALATNDNEQNERFRIRLCQLFRRIEGHLHACIIEGADLGDFRTDLAPLELAHHLMATLQGLLMLAKTYQDPNVIRSGFAVALQLVQK